jgi:putative sterol carrier protein
MSLRRFFDAASGRSSVRNALPDDALVTFDVSGADGGVYTLRRQGLRVEILDGEFPGGVDARMRCPIEVFERLCAGSLNGPEAFRRGRIAVEGDVGLMMRLQTALVASG